MEKSGSEPSEEAKNFLQAGLINYAPACLALAEFRRQVVAKLQGVLNEFSTEFTALGIPVADLRPKFDDPDEAGLSTVRLQRMHSANLFSGYDINWNFSEPKDEQLSVGAWLYAGRLRADRDALFTTIRSRHKSTSKLLLEQWSDGTTHLCITFDPEMFYELDKPFRSLIEEWLQLLTADGGIRSFLSKVTQNATVENTKLAGGLSKMESGLPTLTAAV